MDRSVSTGICTALILILHAGAPGPVSAAPLHREIRVETESDPRLARVTAFERIVHLYGEAASGRAAPPLSALPGKVLPDLEPGDGGGETGGALGWAPFNGSFERDEAAHLLNRTMYGSRFEEIEEAVDRGLAGTVNLLLAPEPTPPAPGAWAT